MLPTALPHTAANNSASTREAAAGVPQMGPPVSGEAGGAGGPRRRAWWGGRRKARGPGQVSAFAAPAALPPGAQRQKSVYNKSQVVGDFIKDKQWGSQPMKQGLKGADGASMRVKGTLSVSKKHSSSAQNLVALAPSTAPFAQVFQPHAAGALCLPLAVSRPLLVALGLPSMTVRRTDAEPSGPPLATPRKVLTAFCVIHIPYVGPERPGAVCTTHGSPDTNLHDCMSSWCDVFLCHEAMV